MIYAHLSKLQAKTGLLDKVTERNRDGSPPRFAQKHFFRLSGWPGIAVTGAMICAFSLIVNIAILIGTSAATTQEADSDKSLLLMFEGSCKTSHRMVIVAHLIINILSTALLAVSGACIQGLGAPSKTEVDQAHRRHQCLHVGTFDLKNLLRIPKHRSSIVILLVLSSFPLHLFYNSVIFFSTFQINAIAYGVFANFMDGGTFDTSNIVDDDANSTLHNILLHGVQSSLREGHSLLECNDPSWFFSVANDGVTDPPFADIIFLVSSDVNKTDSVFSSGGLMCENSLSAVPYWAGDDETCIPIEKCFARPYGGSCAVYLNTTSLAVVISCNTLKLLCMLLCIFIPSHVPLMTVGDAISALLKVEEKGPRPSGLSLTAEGFIDDPERKRQCRFSVNFRFKLSAWRFWLCAPRFTSWALPSVAWIVCISILLGKMINMDQLLPYEMSASTPSQDFGDRSPWGFMILETPSQGLGIESPFNARSAMRFALSANVPQLILSALYLGLNNVLTVMVMSHEYCSFASKRQGLRVTTPTGAQRSSLRLNIPVKYALVNMSVWTILHWLASQMLITQFTRAFSVYDLSGGFHATMFVYVSRMGLLAFVSFGSVVITSTILLGFRRYPRGIPLASTNSAKIAAACHPPADEPENAAELPLMYGKRQDENGQWVHCFSALPVQPIISNEDTNEGLKGRLGWLSNFFGAKAVRNLQRKLLRSKKDLDEDNAILLEDVQTGKD